MEPVTGHGSGASVVDADGASVPPLRINALVGAFSAMADDIDVDAVLEQVTSAACEVVDARYGALGVIGPDQLLSTFITVALERGESSDSTLLPRGGGAPGLLGAGQQAVSPSERAAEFSAQHPGGSSYLGVPIRVRDRVFGNLYLTEKYGGGHFTDTDEQLLVALAAAAAVAISNSHLFDDSTRRTRWLEGGLDTVHEILEQTNPVRSTAEALVHHGVRASQSDLTIVLREIGKGRGLVCEAADGPDAGSFLGASWEFPSMLENLTAIEPPLLLTPSDLDRLLPGSSPATPSVALCVRLAGQGDRQYILFVRREESPFIDVDHEMVRTFTSHVSLALELLRAHRQREQDAVFGDRDRIARDLHDLVIQRLFAAGLSIQSLRRHLVDSEALARVALVTAELDATIRELRDTIYSLRLVPQITPTFSAGIFALVAATSEAYARQPVLHLSGPLDASMDPALAVHVRAVLKEGMSAALRHDSPRALSITLQALPDRFEMGITDDGSGSADDSFGRGLTEMRRHAELCDGTLSISTTPDDGTRVLLTVPLTAQVR